MGIWILTQDKEIITMCNNMQVYEYADGIAVDEDRGGHVINLGFYNTVEDAKKVLCMILNHVNSGTKKVFEMPQKEDV